MVWNPMVAALRDPDPGVRRAAAEALGQLGDARAIELLVVAFRDPYGRVRCAARSARRSLGIKRLATAPDTRAVQTARLVGSTSRGDQAGRPGPAPAIGSSARHHGAYAALTCAIGTPASKRSTASGSIGLAK